MDLDPDSEHVIYLFIAKSLFFCAISELLRKVVQIFLVIFYAIVFLISSILGGM